jgi:UDP-N-acetylglucosamine:LPS N-acetylglucosamine transferase
VRAAWAGDSDFRPGSPDRCYVAAVPQGERRVLLVSSSGGVLLDLLALRPWWSRHDASWVAVPAPDTRELLAAERVTWAEELTPRQPLALARAVRSARAQLRRERIDLVVSAGTGVAVPYFLAARSAGVAAWWVETLNVIAGAGIAARICARTGDLVLVQHSALLRDHPRALFVGELY